MKSDVCCLRYCHQTLHVCFIRRTCSQARPALLVHHALVVACAPVAVGYPVLMVRSGTKWY